MSCGLARRLSLSKNCLSTSPWRGAHAILCGMGKLRLAELLPVLALAALLGSAAGCAVAPKPLAPGSNVVPTPQPGELSVLINPQAPVGGVVPVRVSIANGRDLPYRIDPSQVFAINEAGARVAPLPPGEAALEAGNAEALAGAVESGVASGAVGGGIGAGLGAAAGAAVGGVSQGAIFGGAISAAEAMLTGIPMGQQQAQSQAQQQIGALALRGGPLGQDATMTGYVFYPSGHYYWVEVVVQDPEHGGSRRIRVAWP